MVVALAEGIAETKFRNDFLFYTDFKWADKLLVDLPEDAQGKIDRYIGESGLSIFIGAEVSERLGRLPNRISLKKGEPASRIPFLANPLPFARELVSKLKMLPIRYRSTVALPSIFSEFVVDEAQDSIDLPAGVLIAKGLSLPNPLPIHSSYELIDGGLFHDWLAAEDVDRKLRPDLLYISIPMMGYAYSRASSVLARFTEDYLRAFYGAGIAINFLSYGWNEGKSKIENPYVMIHEEDGRELLATEKLEEELIANRSYFSTEDFSKRNKADLWSEYQSTLSKIGTIFAENVDCRKLFSACIWFYRAKVNRRPLDALLQATIAIEVMLGDRKASEGIGLTNLLESRCAFLLGKSSVHRAEIAANFRKIYDLRSQVVHDGRHSLRTGDREIVTLATKLCAAIINRELTIRAG